MSDELIKEAQDLIREMREAGCEPLLCDIPVPVCSCPVNCGSPSEPGDDDRSEYIMLPKSLVGLNPEMIFPVQGDSMAEAGLEDGDKIRIRIGAQPRDGDTVLACVDGQYTVKAFTVFEDGSVWLVPRNEDYDAILLTEEKDVQFKGVVVGVIKAAPRSTNRDLNKSIRRTMKKMQSQLALEVPTQPESVTPTRPKSVTPPCNTCFFILSNGRTQKECMEKLESILQSSTMQSKVLRKLFGPEGREWFDLYERDLEEIVTLLAQFPAKCGSFTIDPIKKAIAEVRPIIEKEKLERLNARAKTA